MEGRVQDFIRALAARRRVLLLGGLAVIYHGMSREAMGVDIWFEPARDAQAWATELKEVAATFAESLWDLADRQSVDSDKLGELGVVHIDGLNLRLDVFRRPNNLSEIDFEAAWKEAHPLVGEQNLRVIDVIELLVTRDDTSHSGITFLESCIREKLAPILAQCAPEKARALSPRYADHVTCEAALKNPHADVRALALDALREFAAAQNPFAREILHGLGENPA